MQLDEIDCSLAIIERPKQVHTDGMKTTWKQLLHQPQIRKSILTTGAFGIYLMNAGFFCCRALRPYEKGYAPNDLQYLQDQLRCANPGACFIAVLDGLVIVGCLLWGARSLLHRLMPMKKFQRQK